MSMNINNCMNAVSAYLHASGDTGVKKAVSTNKSRNIDTVEFSGAAKAAAGESMTDSTNSARKAAVRNAESSASSERISALRNAVSSGKYFISSDELASAIIYG